MQNKKLYLKYFIYIFNNLFIFVNAFGFLLNACIIEVQGAFPLTWVDVDSRQHY